MTSNADQAPHPLEAYWAQSVDAVLARLRSSPTGLSSAEASSRLAHYGANSIDEETQRETLRLLLRQFANPLVLILAFGAWVSLFVQEWVDAAIILVIVIGSCVLGFWQEYRA